MVKVGIMGAGSWGTALALLLHSNGHEVTVWSISEEEVQSALLEEYIELVLPEDRQSFKNWVNLNTNGEEKENVIVYRIKHNNTVYYIRL